MIEPGGTIGILGSGQLGRMLAMAARTMGYRIITYSPDRQTPGGQVSDVELVAAYEDIEALQSFARQVDVVTLEFENIPVTALEAVALVTPVFPGPNVLQVTQHRLREKRFLQAHGFPVVPFQAVDSLVDLRAAIASLGCPAVLKTAGFGYDGKGQTVITQPSQAESAWQTVGQTAAVLEQRVDLAMELSVIIARTTKKAFEVFGPIENRHHQHILDISVVPATAPEALQRQAVAMASEITAALDLVGLLCVEFFITLDGELIVNELAPRPHNSGHYSLDACVTNQFEQQLRAICGLPLGSTQQIVPYAAMANILGDLWQAGVPNWPAALAIPQVKLHLYGKDKAQPGRKMGHLTALGADLTVVDSVQKARKALH